VIANIDKACDRSYEAIRKGESSSSETMPDGSCVANVSPDIRHPMTFAASRCAQREDVLCPIGIALRRGASTGKVGLLGLTEPWSERQDGPSRFQQIVSSTWQLAQIACVVGGLTVLVLLQVPWLDGPLARAGLNNSESLRTTITVLVLAAVFVETHEVFQRLTRLEGSSRRHFVDVVEMYPFLFSRANAIRNKAHRNMDVLGATLYTAWPQIHYWLQRPEASGWTVRLALMNASMPSSNWLPEDWPRQAAANLSSIREAIDSPELHRQGIKVGVCEYDYMPGVRGVRLGNGDLFISFVLWRPDGRVGNRAEAYEYIPYDEETASAAAMRRLFDSWFQRAAASST
jgi:hypothetical protein